MRESSFNSNSNRRYELVEKIACGGTAEVWRAVQTGSIGFKKTVAVKKVLSSSNICRDLRQLLIDEARVLCHLQHSSIVQVLELCEDESNPFIAMESVDGIDCSVLLTRIIRNRSRMPIELALYAAGEALTALDFAHKKTDDSGIAMNIVHRDVSPSNILISWNGEVKLTDFGIAKGNHRSELTNAGTLKGKFAYMSPEQASGKNIDARSDIYSLGVVIAELILGRKFFDAESDISLLNIVKVPPKLPPDIFDLPREVASLFVSALSPTKKLRYESAGQMLMELRAVQKKLGLIATCVEMAEYLNDVFLDGEKKSYVVNEGDCTGDWQHEELAACKKNTAVMRKPEICSAKNSILPNASVDKKYLSVMLRAIALVAFTFFFFAQSDSFGTTRVENVATQINSESVVAKTIPPAVDVNVREESKKEISVFTQEKGTQKKRLSCIYVSAKPWGKASINGMSAKETPAAFCGVSGEQLISVLHPPTGSRVSEKVNANAQDRISCSANFDRSPQISCR